MTINGPIEPWKDDHLGDIAILELLVAESDWETYLPMRSSGFVAYCRGYEGRQAGPNVEFGPLGGPVAPLRDLASPLPTFSV